MANETPSNDNNQRLARTAVLWVLMFFVVYAMVAFYKGYRLNKPGNFTAHQGSIQESDHMALFITPPPGSKTGGGPGRHIVPAGERSLPIPIMDKDLYVFHMDGRQIKFRETTCWIKDVNGNWRKLETIGDINEKSDEIVYIFNGLEDTYYTVVQKPSRGG